MKKVNLHNIISYIKGKAHSIGAQTLYSVFLMYHAFNREETPFWAKNIILASVAYFLSPFDSIPDLTPFFGFTDDLSVITFGLVTIACFINDEVKTKARKSLGSVIKDYDAQSLEDIDKKL